MFNLELLQAISDWQISSTPARAKALKRECANLPDEFRTCLFVCYRQLGLPKGGVWKLLGDNKLPEKISAWTIDTEVAKGFKDGVPPDGSGYQGTILYLYPSCGSVIVNLWKLYQDESFLKALHANSAQINRYGDGAGRYGNSQAEVVLEIDSVTQDDVYSLGGHSSPFEALVNEAAKYVFQTDGSEATPEQRTALLLRVENLRGEAGPRWLTTKATRRVLANTKPHAEVLVAVKKIQDEHAKAEKR